MPRGGGGGAGTASSVSSSLSFPSSLPYHHTPHHTTQHENSHDCLLLIHSHCERTLVSDCQLSAHYAMSPHQTATNASGYLFQLPPLGVPDPAGDFQFVLAAIGTKPQCEKLLEDHQASSAKPRRIHYLQEGSHALVQVEHEGAIWFLPVFPCNSDAEPELLKMELRRQIINAVPARERRKLPSGTQQVFLSQDAKRLEYGSSSTSIAKELEDDFTFGNPRSYYTGLYDDLEDEAFELLNIWRNPTPAQCVPARPPPGPGGAQGLHAAMQWKHKRKCVKQYAKALLEEMQDECVHKDWLKEVHHEAVVGGVRKPKWDPKAPLVSRRPSHEADFDIRGWDYAWVSQDGTPTCDDATWLPMPARAADPEYIRANVNMMRDSVGKRLFTKKEWPPRPTTRMLEKGMEW